MTDDYDRLERIRFLKMRIEKILALQKAHTQEMKKDISTCRIVLDRAERQLDGGK